MRWDSRGCTVPALEILDWPDNPIRAYKEECRYGSNMMEKQDWLDMIDDLSSKKINNLSLGIRMSVEDRPMGGVAQYEPGKNLYVKLYIQLKDRKA